MNTAYPMTAVAYVPLFILAAMPTPAFGGQAAAPGVAPLAVQAPTTATVEVPEPKDHTCLVFPHLCPRPKGQVAAPTVEGPNATAASTPALAAPALLKIGGVKGESSDMDHGKEIQVLSFSWGELRQGVNIRKPPNRASSDPEEGGEVDAQNRSTARKVKVSDMIVAKPMDKASAKLAGPLPSGGATVVVARGSLAKGKHIPVVVITMRSHSYELQGVEVTDCTAMADGTDSCSLTYQSLGQ